jgi:hypothetical protein
MLRKGGRRALAAARQRLGRHLRIIPGAASSILDPHRKGVVMRVWLGLVLLLFLGTFVPFGRTPPPRPLPAISTIHFAPVPLDDSDLGRRRLGGLVWLGGWKLTSNDRRFGGVSAMELDGGRVTAFSDAGWRFVFDLPRGGTVPAAISGAEVRAEIGPLPEGPGDKDYKADRDIESMIQSADSVWLGFERRNAVWRFDRRDWHVTSWAAPRPMRRWPVNRGPEAMLRLADGRFLVFIEGLGSQKESEVLLFSGDPSVPGTPWVRLHYAKPAGYRTSDAAPLPDGRALMLNRRFAFMEGVSAKLSIVDLSGLREGAVLRGTQIADFHRPINEDNMEALSVTREAGRTILWIASDDNYNPLQRTLLMKFALVEKGR